MIFFSKSAVEAKWEDKKNGIPEHLKTVIIYNYTKHSPIIVSCPKILDTTNEVVICWVQNEISSFYVIGGKCQVTF